MQQQNDFTPEQETNIDMIRNEIITNYINNVNIELKNDDIFDKFIFLESNIKSIKILFGFSENIYNFSFDKKEINNINTSFKELYKNYSYLNQSSVLLNTITPQFMTLVHGLMNNFKNIYAFKLYKSDRFEFENNRLFNFEIQKYLERHNLQPWPGRGYALNNLITYVDNFFRSFHFINNAIDRLINDSNQYLDNPNPNIDKDCETVRNYTFNTIKEIIEKNAIDYKNSTKIILKLYVNTLKKSRAFFTKFIQMMITDLKTILTYQLTIPNIMGSIKYLKYMLFIYFCDESEFKKYYPFNQDEITTDDYVMRKISFIKNISVNLDFENAYKIIIESTASGSIETFEYVPLGALIDELYP